MNTVGVFERDEELTQTQECVQSSQEINVVPASPDQHVISADMQGLPLAPLRHGQEGANAYGPSMPPHRLTEPRASLPEPRASLATDNAWLDSAWLEDDHAVVLSQFLEYNSQGVHAYTCVHLH
jgi:hypothetical protein